MTKLSKIEGIGEVYRGQLEAVGVGSIEELLDKASTPKGRQALAAEADISPKLILGWANRADLFRIKGIGEEYSDLLEVAGVDTVPELARRNPENLHAALEAANDEKEVVRQTPALSAVESWVSQAKDLPRKLEY